MTIYQDMTAAGIPTDNHESDLYVRDCEDARQILENHDKRIDGWNVSRFRSAIDGDHWLDIPFAFDPFWERKS